MATNYSDADLVALFKQYDKEEIDSHKKFPNRYWDIVISYQNRKFELLKRYEKL